MAETYPIVFAMQVEGDSEVQSKMNQTGDSIENLGASTEKTTSRTSAFTSTLKNSALGLTTAIGSAASLAFQYDNLDKISTRVDKAQKTLTTSQATLIDAQQRLNDLVEKGVNSGPDYESAQLKLTAAQDGLNIATDRLHQTQGDLTQAQTNFALQIIPTAISSVSAFTGVITGLKNAKLFGAAASGTEALAEKAATASRWLSIPATTGATAATGGLTLATRLLHIAMGPVGWAIGGIAVLMGLFATNAFGVRDAINAAGKAIGDAFPIMRPLLTGLSELAKLIFPEAAIQSEQASTTIASSMSTASSVGSNEFDSLASNVGASADSIVADANRIAKAMKKIGVKSVGDSMDMPVQTKTAVKGNILASGSMLGAYGSPDAFPLTPQAKAAPKVTQTYNGFASAGDSILARGAANNKLDIVVTYDEAGIARLKSINGQNLTGLLT
jgi:hypothetical protein